MAHPRIDERLADYLRAMRHLADLSQRELSARAAMPTTTLARLEAAKVADPRLSTLMRLIDAAGFRLMICDGDHKPIMPQSELHAQCVDLAGRRLPAHLDVRLVLDDPMRPWWRPKRGDYTFIRDRGFRDEVRAKRAETFARYIEERARREGWDDGDED
jgi:transcriptional regulator with XRE-family HTH domain